MFDKLQQIKDWPGVTRFECWIGVEIGPKHGMLDEPEEAYEVFRISVVRGGQLYRTRIIRNDMEHQMNPSYRPTHWLRRCELAVEEMLDMLGHEEFNHANR